MSYAPEQYREQLKALLPPGAAFTRDAGSRMHRLADSLSLELSRIDARLDALPAEALPLTTAEILADWERVAGLPDNCSGLLGPTLGARRADLVAKLASVGGQSRAYYQGVAAAIGFAVFIDEFRPFRAGASRAGDEITNGDWVFTWRVLGPEQTVSQFRAGAGSAGEPLATWGNSALECRIRQLAPAHTVVIFAYGGSRYLLLQDASLLLLQDGGGLLLQVQS